MITIINEHGTAYPSDRPVSASQALADALPFGGYKVLREHLDWRDRHGSVTVHVPSREDMAAFDRDVERTGRGIIRLGDVALLYAGGEWSAHRTR